MNHISFQKLYNSRGESSVLKRQAVRLLSTTILAIIKYSFNFCTRAVFYDQSAFKALTQPNFGLSFQVLQKSLSFHFSLYRANQHLELVCCSMTPLSVWFSFPAPLFLILTTMNIFGFTDSRPEWTSVNRTLMLSFVKVMGNDRISNRFDVRLLKSK